MVGSYLVLVLLLCSSTTAKLVLPTTPPRGFNTFDSYSADVLNTSRVTKLIDTLAASPLFTKASYGEHHTFAAGERACLL